MALSSIPARLFGQAETRPNDPAYHVRGPNDWETTNWPPTREMSAK